jgi:hypothetical protein
MKPRSMLHNRSTGALGPEPPSCSAPDNDSERDGRGKRRDGQVLSMAAGTIEDWSCSGGMRRCIKVFPPPPLCLASSLRMLAASLCAVVVATALLALLWVSGGWHAHRSVVGKAAEDVHDAAAVVVADSPEAPLHGTSTAGALSASSSADGLMAVQIQSPKQAAAAAWNGCPYLERYPEDRLVFIPDLHGDLSQVWVLLEPALRSMNRQQTEQASEVGPIASAQPYQITRSLHGYALDGVSLCCPPDTTCFLKSDLERGITGRGLP